MKSNFVIRAAVVVFMGLALVTCGKSTPAPAGGAANADNIAAATSDEADSNARKSTERDPCSVLDVADVEAVIGKLAGPPFRTNGPNSLDPDSNGDTCRYEAANFRGLSVDMTWTEGGKLQSMAAAPGNLAAKTGMKGQLPKGAVPEGVEVAGDWDEASVTGCCLLNAYYADSMISIEFSESRASMQQVAGLVNKVISHLGKPTSIDGRAGTEAAQERAAQRPKKRPVCQLLSQADVERVVGALDSTPTGDESKCEYSVRAAPNTGATPDHFTASVAWTWGYSEFRMAASMNGSVTASLEGPLNGISMPGIPAEKMKEFENLAKSMGGNVDKLKSVTHDLSHPSQTGLEGPWDDAAFLAPDFLAVKNDVSLKIEGLDSEHAKLLATSIMAKL